MARASRWVSSSFLSRKNAGASFNSIGVATCSTAEGVGSCCSICSWARPGAGAPSSGSASTAPVIAGAATWRHAAHSRRVTAAIGPSQPRSAKRTTTERASAR